MKTLGRFGESPPLFYETTEPTRCRRRFMAASSPSGVRNLGFATPRPLSHHVRLSTNRAESYASSRRAVGSLNIGVWMLSLLILLLCGTIVTAGRVDDRPLLQETLDRLARRGEIVVDRRPPPVVGELQRRQFSGGTDRPTSSTTAPTDSSSAQQSGAATTSNTPSSSSPSGSGTVSPSATSSMVTDPNAQSSSPLPKPFDTNIGANFTNSCANFFQQFKTDNNLNACLPLSLLLQNSNSFFQATKSLVRITQVLDVTCSVNFNDCSNLMSHFAQEIGKDTNCGADFRNQNPVVTQAYSGLIAYQPLYQAGCLKSESGSYCFADAVTNTLSPSDSFVYWIAVGLAGAGDSRPSCTSCLQKTMPIFATAASNSTQPVSRLYTETAQLIDLSCGPNFVNATIPAAKSSASTIVPLTLAASFGRLAMLVALVACVATTWLI